jgi:hypothetical protein
MSSKVVEAGAGIHSLAMAVAPVTSWRLYGMSFSQVTDKDDRTLADSIYTERYMGLPKNNPDGYVNASVSSVEGFRHVDFLLAHGKSFLPFSRIVSILILLRICKDPVTTMCTLPTQLTFSTCLLANKSDDLGSECLQIGVSVYYGSRSATNEITVITACRLAADTGSCTNG